MDENAIVFTSLCFWYRFHWGYLFIYCFFFCEVVSFYILYYIDWTLKEPVFHEFLQSALFELYHIYFPYVNLFGEYLLSKLLVLCTMLGSGTIKSSSNPCFLNAHFSLKEFCCYFCFCLGNRQVSGPLQCNMDRP